jgi:glutamine amidotransferase
MIMNNKSGKFVIIDYQMGNLQSVANAFYYLGIEPLISNKKEDILMAEAIIIPGVGAFAEAMNNLNQLGIIPALTEQVMVNKLPFLGICLGMQLIAEDSEEGGVHKGLGWIPAHVRKISVQEDTKLPHIGWNDIVVFKKDPLFTDIKRDFNFYFVHSFHVECSKEYISAVCDYDGEVTASLQKDNIFATQFHPEKSQENGLRLLRSFINHVKPDSN